MFGVCLDWPLRGALTEAVGLSTDEARRVVHATQDTTVHRLPRPGDRLTTGGRVVSAEPRPPGAHLVVRYDTADAAGEPVLTTFHGAIYRGVECVGEPRRLEASPLLPCPSNRGEGGSVDVPVPRWAPHVYTECSGIWNPIHTERAFARSVGLPDVIVHGTHTLALAVREVVDRAADGDPSRLARVACRFGAMVIPGGPIGVRLSRPTPAGGGFAVGFDVANAEGARAIRDGVVLMRG